MVEYGFQHPKKHQKFSIKKWLYVRYAFHHFIEEIGRGMFFFMLCHVTSCNVLSCDALPCDSLSQMKRPAQCAKKLFHLRVRALDLICNNVSVTSHVAPNHITAPQVTSQLTTLLH